MFRKALQPFRVLCVLGMIVSLVLLSACGSSPDVEHETASQEVTAKEFDICRADADCEAIRPCSCGPKEAVNVAGIGDYLDKKICSDTNCDVPPEDTRIAVCESDRCRMIAPKN